MFNLLWSKNYLTSYRSSFSSSLSPSQLNSPCENTVLHYMEQIHVHTDTCIVATFSQIINVEILNSRLLNSLQVSISIQ